MICSLCVKNVMIHLDVLDGELYSSMVHDFNTHVHSVDIIQDCSNLCGLSAINIGYVS